MTSENISRWSPFVSPKRIYKQYVTGAERDSNEHPYEFIQQTYSESTPNARLTGLPGYSPPWFARILNGVTYYLSYILLIATLQFIITVSIALLATGIEFISTVEFTVSIPYTGWIVADLSPAGTSPANSIIIIMTPVLASFLLFWSSIILFMGANKLSRIVSRPFEEEYASWLDELEPTNTAYPPSVGYALRGENFDVSSVPESAPPTFRPLRKLEKGMYVIKTIKTTIWMMFFRTLLLQNQMMLKQTAWVEDVEEVDRRHSSRSD